MGVRVRLGDGNCYPRPNRGDGECSEDKKQPGGELRIPRKWPWIEHMFIINIRWVDAWMDDEWAWGQGKEEGGGLPTSQELLVGTDRADTDFLVDDIHTAEAERDRGTGPGET